jgi:hypothetical protein
LNNQLTKEYLAGCPQGPYTTTRFQRSNASLMSKFFFSKVVAEEWLEAQQTKIPPEAPT